MPKKEDLIRENTELRMRLEIAENWMQREVRDAKKHINKKVVQSNTRKHFANFFEQEGVDIITQKINVIFGNTLQNAPEYTLERLIDSEIYWQTFQKYPTIDGLPMILSYQKIIDSWIEDNLVYGFRILMKDKYFSPEGHPLTRDIENILTKKYNLSIGRLYQILGLIRDGGNITGILYSLVSYWQKNLPDIFSFLISDDFFLPFSELMDREIFTKKRHEKKVTFSDIQKIRDILIENKILFALFSSCDVAGSHKI